MAFESGTFGMDALPAFIEALQNDFKTLSFETKKKYPQIKEVIFNNNNTFLMFFINEFNDFSHVRRL